LQVAALFNLNRFPINPIGNNSPTYWYQFDSLENSISPSFKLTPVGTITYESTLNNNANTISIGYQAGQNTQGQNSIAIGYQAGQTYQTPNSIILNASLSPINLTNGSALYINPIRLSDLRPGTNPTSTSKILCWDTISKEVFANNTKSFIIDHPLNTDKYLVHACLEGPEVGVYYRGIIQVLDRFVEVLLPSYVDTLAYNFTVHVTHVFNEDCDTTPKTYAATPVKNNSFRIYGPEGAVSWVVYGKRGDIEVEPLKASVNVKGAGPYKWI